MSDGTDGRGYPHRDEQGRLVGLVDLLGIALAGLVLGVAALLLVEGVLALVGVGRFGQANGWLAAILPVWLFAEEFRAWRGVPGRLACGLVGAAVAIALGALAQGLLQDLPPAVTGAVGAAVAVLGYALIWFYGIRWLGGRTGDPGRPGRSGRAG